MGLSSAELEAANAHEAFLEQALYERSLRPARPGPSPAQEKRWAELEERRAETPAEPRPVQPLAEPAPWTPTPRQREAVEMVLAGLTNRQIARVLGCSERNVQALLTKVYRETGCGGRRGLEARTPYVESRTGDTGRRGRSH